MTRPKTRTSPAETDPRSGDGAVATDNDGCTSDTAGGTIESAGCSSDTGGGGGVKTGLGAAPTGSPRKTSDLSPDRKNPARTRLGGEPIE